MTSLNSSWTLALPLTTLFVNPTLAQKIYWVEDGTDSIRRANLDGSNIETVFQRIFYRPLEIDVDPIHGKLYWTDTNFVIDRSWIGRANLNGSNVEFLSPPGIEYPFGIAVDPEGGKDDWSEHRDPPLASLIRRADLDGTESESILSGVVALGIALDLANEKIYWAGQNIMRANLDGSQPETVVTSRSETGTSGVALDAANGKVYWTEGYFEYGNSSRVKRANLNGTNIETLVSGGGGPQGISLDLVHGKIYWADNSGTGLDAILGRRANLDGTNVENLQVGLPWGVAVDQGAGNVYWVGGHLGTHLGITRSTVDATNATILLENEISNPCDIAIDPFESRLYWSDGNQDDITQSLRRSNLDGTGIENLNDPFAWNQICGLALDPIARKLYWSDRENMRRSNLDGSNRQTIAPMGWDAFPSSGVAVDPAGGKLYWSSIHSSSISSYGQIRRVDLSSQNLEQIFYSTSDRPSGVALDPLHEHLYFSRSGPPARIQRSDLSGEDTQDVLTLQSGVGGLALDPIAKKLYWTTALSNDPRLGVIRRANLNGTEPEDVVTVPDYPTSMALELPLHLIGSVPYSCSIDARQPSDPANPNQPVGWTYVDVFMSMPIEAVDSADFSVEQFGGTDPAPMIAGTAMLAAGVVRVVFSAPIQPGAWTCVVHNPSGTKACLGFLPGDVDGDGYSGRADILALINDLNHQTDPPLALWQKDIDRSNDANPADILRLIDLLNGAGSFESWLGRTLSECP